MKPGRDWRLDLLLVLLCDIPLVTFSSSYSTSVLFNLIFGAVCVLIAAGLCGQVMYCLVWTLVTVTYATAPVLYYLSRVVTDNPILGIHDGLFIMLASLPAVGWMYLGMVLVDRIWRNK